MTDTLRRLDPSSVARAAERVRKALHDATGGRAERLVALHLGQPDRFGAGFSGTTFETLGTNDPARVTSDDLAAAGLHGFRFRPTATRALVEDGLLNDHLGRLPVDVDVWDADADLLADVEAAWTTLVEVDGIGWDAASTMLARKRPRLVPCSDETLRQGLALEVRDAAPAVIAEVLGDTRLRARLDEIRGDAPVSLLRVATIAAWMRVSGTKAAREARLLVGMAPS